MTKIQRHKRRREAVALLQKYMNTYSEQAHYEDYTDKTYVDDVLYGLGISLSGVTDYSGPGGYERFKAFLRDHLDGRLPHRHPTSVLVPGEPSDIVTLSEAKAASNEELGIRAAVQAGERSVKDILREWVQYLTHHGRSNWSAMPKMKNNKTVNHRIWKAWERHGHIVSEFDQDDGRSFRLPDQSTAAG